MQLTILDKDLICLKASCIYFVILFWNSMLFLSLVRGSLIIDFQTQHKCLIMQSKLETMPANTYLNFRTTYKSNGDSVEFHSFSFYIRYSFI